ncbi:MAG: hypothetical protein KDD47_10705, partial [Acidobacteria bacterium]|nr:hypothetical protein [Acidobacteriota bacterium]
MRASLSFLVLCLLGACAGPLPEAGPSLDLPLSAGEIAFVEVDQKTADVRVVVYGPGGGQILSLDNSFGTAGPERLCLLVGEGGTYRAVALPLVAGEQPAAPRLLERRPAAADDRSCWQGMERFARAASLRGGSPREEDLRRALPVYQEAAELFHQARRPYLEAVARTEAASVLVALGEPSRAVEDTARVAELVAGLEAHGLPWPRLEVRTLLAHGRSLRQLRRLEEAEAVAGRALEAAEARDLSRERIEAYEELGSIAWSRRQPVIARAFFERCRALSTGAGDLRGRVRAYENLASTYTLMARPVDARTFARQGLELLEEAEGTSAALPSMEAGLRFELGWALQQEGDPAPTAIYPLSL